MYRTEEAYETYLSPKKDFKGIFFFVFSCHLSLSLINLSTGIFPWNKKDKTQNFTENTSNVINLTMLEAIRKYQDDDADEVSENLVSEFMGKRNIWRFQ